MLLRSIVEQSFGTAVLPADIDDEALVIHQRQPESANRCLLVLVHGLGGKRYGWRNTWGSLPKYLYQDIPDVDIGMYGYLSGAKRWKCWESIPIPRTVEVLVNELLALWRTRRYDNVVLLGHSLGGIVAKGVVHELVASEAPGLVSDVILAAVPQLGSLIVPRRLARFTADGRILAAHSEYLQELHDTFTDRVHTRFEPPDDDRIHVRVWGVIAASDWLVDPLSSGIGIPKHQKVLIKASHPRVVKPRSRADVSYPFIRECVVGAKSPRAAAYSTVGVRPAGGAELGTLREFACSFFGNVVSQLDIMEEWREIHPGCFQLLERTSKSNGRTVRRTAGYFCVLPLTPEAADALLSGEMTTDQLGPKDTPRWGEKILAAYVGGVAAIDRESQAAAIHFLVAHLQSLAAEVANMRVLARPITPDGLRLVRSYSFTCGSTGTAASGMGVVHESNIEGWAFAARAARRKAKRDTKRRGRP